MINEILDFSRGTAGKLAIEPELLDWLTFLKEVERTAQVLALVNGNKFVLRNSGMPLSGVFLDERRVRQVLDNLLANAARHTKKGRIQLDCAAQLQSDGRLKLDFEISDSGDGILLADQDRIFLPFERGSTQTRAGGKGMGMGLAISRQLVEAMGGHLTLRSAPGDGATFSFSVLGELKDVPQWHFQARKNRRRHTQYKGASRTVLVVDDDQLSRQVLVRLLRDSGFAVMEAYSGQSASRLLDDCVTLDLVLTDQFMEDGDGWDVLQAVKERFFDVPVVMLSAAPPEKPEHFPEQMECAEHVLKPANHLELLELIGNLLHLEWIRPTRTAPAVSEQQLDGSLGVAVWYPAEDDIQALRYMIGGGRVSDIMDWATALQARDEGAAMYAREVKDAIKILDFKALNVLAGL